MHWSLYTHLQPAMQWSAPQMRTDPFGQLAGSGFLMNGQKGLQAVICAA